MSTPSRGRLPVARRDRRPLLAALAVMLILLGALGSALIAFRSGDRVSVLAANRDIAFGEVLAAEDFVEVRTAANTPGVVAVEFRDRFVGTQSLSYIPEGSLVNGQMFSEATPVPAGGQLVGVVLEPTRRPSDVPRAGQVVRAYFVKGDVDDSPGADYTPGDVIVEAARVLATGAGASGESTNVTLLVRDQDAGALANYASSGNVALAILPDDTEPTIDFVETETAGVG